MQLSSQQTAAIDFIKNSNKSLILSAVAGAGKTSTLLAMLKATEGSVAFCAFNKSIAKEIELKVNQQNINKDVKVGTVHSFGFGAIRRSISRVNVDGNKIQTIVRDNFNNEESNMQTFLISAVAMAKEVGIRACVNDNYNTWIQMFDHYDLWNSLPLDVNTDKAIGLCQDVLDISNKTLNVVDFSDMIYLPILKKMRIWKYSNIFLDEAQDTNATRRALVKMMLAPKGRLIAVGDPHQAIYGFTGADSNALDLIQKEFKAKELPLSVTFRCPKNVVKLAQQYVSHIESHPDSADGIVDECNLQDLPNLVTQEDAIICRNTKPLVEVAYNLIRNKIPCKVEGRKIGEGLIKLATRWKVKTVGTLINKLEAYKEKEIEKYKKKENESMCQVIEDQVETLAVFIDQCKVDDPISTLISKIQELFDDTENKKILVLSTIHRSKGREWNRVFALGINHYSPSKYAKKDWELVQENNLLYVLVTRAKNHLTMVNVSETQKTS
jgi:DNA helicase II / ATP-dependent DNA helicase PcrA